MNKRELETLLKNNGYKCTNARLSILKIFSENKKPLDAENITKNITEKNINEATIYRTLSAFEKSGILKRVYLRKESLYFELNNDHHHHIICTKCNLIEIFKDCEINKTLERIVEKSSEFKNIKEHSFELFGLCKKCSLAMN